jgi:sporulation protein YlmC with PRC-barrel domain
VELSREPAPFSDLVGRPVRDQGGRDLGRVFEARAHWERDGSIVIDELLVGRRGLWRRLRGPGEDDRGIPWEAVVDLGDEHVVVRV